MNSRLLILWLALALGAARAAEPTGPDRWAKDMAAFEAADRTSPPRPGGVVFVGSSSVRLWTTLAEDFPEVRPLNRGFGGSRVADCTYYLDRLVTVHRPRLVVFYCGGNDLADGRTPEEVAADFRAFCAKFHAALPDAKLVVNSIKITPSRWKLREPIAFANALVAAHCAADPRRTFVDLTPAVLTPDGAPREELYVEDRLHLNAAGYAIWRDQLKPYVN